MSTSSRPHANFQPSVWGDQFLHFHESDHNNHVHEEDQMVEQLKEEVKCMLKKAATNDYVEQVEIVDVIQRLGIAYQFGEEIDQVLQDVFEKFDNYCESNMNLHTVALSFRLLRQHGYRVSSEIFEKFKDAKGNWIAPKIEPAKGILELFEATHLRVHNEDVLDDGFVSSRDYLDSVLPSLDSPYNELVHYALEQNSYRRGFPRMEARHYISIYGKFTSHNRTLLGFAKLDFNRLQSMHKKELSEISRWWKDLDVQTNYPYGRDRLPLSYLWAMLLYFEPEYALGRIILCKVFALLTLVDDRFDAYGTFEELKLFNEAIERWDISCLDQLPDYMKLLYDALLRVFAEIEEMIKLGVLHWYTNVKEGFDKNRVHIPSAVECYIVEHKVGKKEAIDELNNIIEAKWKDINNAFLRPTEVPVPLLDRCVNVARIMEIFYNKGDLFTHVGPETKAIVNQTLVDPIPQ